MFSVQCITCTALTMVYDESIGHSQESTVRGPLIMHTMLSATHKFSSRRLLDTLWPMDRARNTHKLAVVPITATSTMWTAISDVVMVENPSSVEKKTHYKLALWYFELQNLIITPQSHYSHYTYYLSLLIFPDRQRAIYTRI